MKENIILRKMRHFICATICFCLLICSIVCFSPKAYAASAMTASESCIEFIKQFEGFSPQPYYDYHQYTVGYGTRCPTEKYFYYKAYGIPKQEAEALLLDSIADIEKTINKKLIDKYNLSLSQNQFDALVSFSFNIGTGWISYNSSLKNAILNDPKENDLVYAFGLYCTAGGKYSPGLITRRLCEANIYLNGVYSKKISEDYGYVYYDANGGTLTYRVQGFVCDNNSAPVADAVRNGDVFLGWYTNLTGGSHVDALNETLTGRTLFARWQSAENPENQNSSSTTVKVTGDVVNIRSGPGTNYGRVKQVYRNDILVVSHITDLTSMKWGKVQDGWICLEHTNYDDVINGTDHKTEENNEPSHEIPDSEDPSTSVDTNMDADPSQDKQSVVVGVVKVNDLLRIRKGPGTNYTTVGFLFNGKEVDILEQTTVGSMVWARISRGWVSMDYIITNENSMDSTIESDTDQPQETTPTKENPVEVKPEEEEPTEEPTEENPSPEETMGSVGETEATAIKGKIIADALRIRASAGTTNPIVGFYYQNEMVVVVEKILVDSVYWGKTNRGWINMDYVLADSSDGEIVPPADSVIRTVIGDCLRIRKGPGTNYKISALLYYGDTVAVYETKTIDGIVWGKVDKGWICMDYVN